MSTKTAVRVGFVLERETPNTRKFKEVTEDGKAQAIGTLYVKKDTLHDLGNPEILTVTIES